MNLVAVAKLAMFPHLNTIRIVLFVLYGCVVPLLTFRASLTPECRYGKSAGKISLKINFPGVVISIAFCCTGVNEVLIKDFAGTAIRLCSDTNTAILFYMTITLGLQTSPDDCWTRRYQEGRAKAAYAARAYSP
jgi:hypothetical protein